MSYFTAIFLVIFSLSFYVTNPEIIFKEKMFDRKVGGQIKHICKVFRSVGAEKAPESDMYTVYKKLDEKGIDHPLGDETVCTHAQELFDTINQNEMVAYALTQAREAVAPRERKLRWSVYIGRHAGALATEMRKRVRGYKLLRKPESVFKKNSSLKLDEETRPIVLASILVHFATLQLHRTEDAESYDLK